MLTKTPIAHSYTHCKPSDQIIHPTKSGSFMKGNHYCLQHTCTSPAEFELSSVATDSFDMFPSAERPQALFNMLSVQLMIPSQSLALPGCMLMCNMLFDDYIWPSSKAKPSALALASRAFRSWFPREAASGGGTALPIWRCLLWTLPQNWKSSGKPCIDKVSHPGEAGATQIRLHILG